MKSRYGFGKTVANTFDATLEKVTRELQKEDFGILTEIDVAATLTKKLNHDIPPYRILGACNPPFAMRALMAEPTVGLLLHCNVVVRQDNAGTVHVEFMDPGIMRELTTNADIGQVTSEVRERLQRVFGAL